MKWTTKMPTELGWYWCRLSPRHDAVLAMCEPTPGKSYVKARPPFSSESVSLANGEWCGPLVPPE